MIMNKQHFARGTVTKKKLALPKLRLLVQSTRTQRLKE